ncbi:MAG: hypothetical protein MUF66_15355 [Gammaproteobacteria bacterium]|nr:hypothetical protein [Gammaproteobacteria bacterium]
MVTRTSVRLFVASLAAAVSLGAWVWLNQPEPAADWHGTINGVSFSPFQRGQDPLAERFPSSEDIDRDLTLVADQVKRVRTYSSLDGIEDVPRLAANHGLTVTAGAWLDQRMGRNEQEIVNLIRNAKTYRNIDRLIVGNEAVLRADLTVDRLIRYLKVVRKATGMPVSTAEPWHVWLKHPELVREVDFIAVHILPYWEGVPAEGAINYVLYRYDELRAKYPGKPILIAEVGWPSGGSSRAVAGATRDAEATRVNQAQFVRSWLNTARERGIEYFIMEAFDQPWKRVLGHLGRRSRTEVRDDRPGGGEPALGPARRPGRHPGPAAGALVRAAPAAPALGRPRVHDRVAAGRRRAVHLEPADAPARGLRPRRPGPVGGPGRGPAGADCGRPGERLRAGRDALERPLGAPVPAGPATADPALPQGLAAPGDL